MDERVEWLTEREQQMCEKNNSNFIQCEPRNRTDEKRNIANEDGRRKQREQNG